MLQESKKKNEKKGMSSKHGTEKAREASGSFVKVLMTTVGGLTD